MGVIRGRLRVLLLDGLLAVAVGAFTAFATLGTSHWQVPPNRPLDPLAFTLIGIASAGLLIRRVRVTPAVALTVVATATYIAFNYPYGPAFFPLLLAMYTLGAHSTVRRSLSVCGGVVLALMAGHWAAWEEGNFSVPQVTQEGGAALAFTFLPWALGTIVGIRRESATQTRRAESRRYADEERLRIAQEVHDVVGHGLSVINMQAGVALHVLDRRPEQARPALEAIKKTSKESLDELRGTLAVFRQPGGSLTTLDGDAPTRPLPGLEDLDALVAGMTESGLRVDVRVTGERDEVPAAVDLAAYRITQEALTNVGRHAGRTTVIVRVTYEPGEIVLDIIDSGRARTTDPPATGGHGIAGMRERAAALGGTLQASPRVEGGFRVHARLPLGENS